MVDLKYKSSNEIEFDLHDFDSAKLFKANFHSVEWIPEVVVKQFGTVVNRFTKNPQKFECTFRFLGDPAQRKAQIDAFIFETENDVAKLLPGRIYWNEQYIDIYFITHSCYPVDSGDTWTELKGQFYAPFPFWLEEKRYHQDPSSPYYPESGFPPDVKGFPMDREMVYGYTYSYPYGTNSGVYYVDSPIGADFSVVIYGPQTRVKIEVAGNNYQVNYPLLLGEKLIVDSRDILPIDKKCYVIKQNNEEVNVFDYRDPSGFLFKKFPSGDVVITCETAYEMDIILYLERSGPI